MNEKNRRAVIVRSCLLAALFAGAVSALVPHAALADEGGVSFWAPGTYGSMAAVPGTPGWSLGALYYHNSVSASATKEFPIGARITAGLDVKADLVMLSPTYTFSGPVLGGQPAVSLAALYGRAEVSANATLTGPRGGVLSGRVGDSLTAFGDLYPAASLRWNDGNHNYLAYAMLGVPVGRYQSGRLANMGTNHWSLDAGGGYTYLNQQTGREFSAVLGLTDNEENRDTHYRNGIDGHLEWGVSQFLSPQWQIGLAGYFYQQLTGDRGAGARLGDFKSQVSAIGPQVGYFFPVGGRPAYLGFKAYYEFDARNRPSGWNAWVTLSVPLGSGKK